MRLLLPAITLAAGTSACVHLPEMIQAKQYREAVCIVDDEGLRSPNAPVLGRAVEKDLRPEIEIHALTAAELEERLAGKEAESIPFARVVFARFFTLRVRITSRPVDLEGAGVNWVIHRGGEYLPPQAMVRDDLVKLFGERIAPSKTHQPGALDSLSAWGKHAWEHPVENILTLGAWSAATGPAAKATEEMPSDAERRKLAPITERLIAAFPLTNCSEAPGKTCEEYVLYPREGAEHAPMTVELRYFLKAHEDATLFRHGRTCAVIEWTKVPLPAAPTVEERFAARFPEGLRPLSAFRR